MADLSLKVYTNGHLKIPWCSEVSAEDVAEGMVCDSSDPRLQILNNDKVVESVLKEDIINVEIEADTGQSAGDAFAGL